MYIKSGGRGMQGSCEVGVLMWPWDTSRLKSVNKLMAHEGYTHMHEICSYVLVNHPKRKRSCNMQPPSSKKSEVGLKVVTMNSASSFESIHALTPFHLHK